MRLWGARQVANGPAAVAPKLRWRDPSGRWGLEVHPLVVAAISAEAANPSALIGLTQVTAPESLHFDVRRVSRLRSEPNTSIRAELLELRTASAFSTGAIIGFSIPAQAGSIEHFAATLSDCLDLLPEYTLLLRPAADQSVAVHVWKKGSAQLEPLPMRIERTPDPLAQPAAMPSPLMPAGPPAAFQPAPAPVARPAIPPLAPYRPPEAAVQLEVPKWVWATGLALLALIAAAIFLYKQPLQPTPVETAANAAAPPSTAELNLRVKRVDGSLQVEWERGVGAALGAQSGLLQVSDGSQHLDIPLGQLELNSGRILYVPRSANTEFLLTVFGQNRMVQETMKVIGSGGSGSGSQPMQVVSARSRSVPTSAPAAAQAAARPPQQRPEQQVASVLQPQQPAAPTPAPAQPASRVSDTVQSDTVQPFYASTAAARPQPQASNPAGIAVPIQQRRPEPVATTPAPSPEQQTTPAPAPPQTVQTAQTAANPPLQTQPRPVNQRIPVPPSPIRQVMPVVPAHLRTIVPRNGTVEVRLTVDAQGNVSKVDTGNPGGVMSHLARIAADAARKWKFKPATVDGQPVPAEHVIRFKFGQQ